VFVVCARTHLFMVSTICVTESKAHAPTRTSAATTAPIHTGAFW
jgi:hypothetical protein